jgi:16S rRNA processing protein RimM
LSLIIERIESETFNLGRIVKVHGVNGRLVTRLDRPAHDVLDFPEWMFIRIDGGLVPFSVTEESVFQKDANHIVVGLDEIDGPEAAATYTGLACKLEGKWADWFEAGREETGSLTGFAWFDEVSGKSGTVTGFEDIPGNPLLGIELNGKSALLPMQDEFVISIDTQNRRLVVRIPDGLLEL